MKKLILVVLLATIFSFSTQAQNFTWVRGNNFNGAVTGTYGVQGVPASTNDPGHRHGAATWTDASGNLWLFGGEGISSSTPLSWLNDLWKYNPSTNQWTWIRGSNGPNAIGNYGVQTVSATANEPGAREFPLFWTDSQGNFWLFGGDGFANSSTFGRLGDLWKYDPVNNVWTWMKGFNTINNNGIYGTLNVASASNLPGARYSAGTWADANGNLWLFGGRGYPSTGSNLHMNDLWKYNIASNNWTWMGGSNLGAQNGSYGTLSVPATTNIPGAVEFPCSWVDNSGNFYLFSGRGYVGSGSPGYTSDMWRYNPTTAEWTWLKGPNLTNQFATYGTLGVSSPATIPGGRYSVASWKDAGGNFWMFGGFGYSSVNLSAVNDLFKYDPLTNQFTWMKGAIVPNSNGVYGTMGAANAANVPGARYYTPRWRGLNGDLWLLGGEGFDISSTSFDNMNDLWKFTVPCNPDSITVSPGKLICTGNTLTLTANNQYPSTVSWYSSPSSTQSIGSGSVLTPGTLTTSATSTVYTYYAQSNSCTLTPRTAVNITVTSAPTVSISGPSVTCSGSSVTLVASGATSYTWTSSANTASYVVSPTVASAYVVTGATAPGCQSLASFSVAVNPLPTLSIASSYTNICLFYSYTLTASGANTYTWSNSSNATSITFTPITTGVKIFTLSGTDLNGCKNSTVKTFSVFGCGIGLNELSPNQLTINLFPNPNQGNFTLEVNNELKDARLEITNLLGQVIHSETINSKQVNLNLNLPKGVYFIRLRSSDNKTGAAKFVIE